MTSVTDPKEAIADCCGVMLRKICSSCSSCLMTDSRTVGVLVSASIVICLIWANRLVDRLMLAERSNWLAASLGMAPLNRRPPKPQNPNTTIHISYVTRLPKTRKSPKPQSNLRRNRRSKV